MDYPPRWTEYGRLQQSLEGQRQLSGIVREPVGSGDGRPRPARTPSARIRSSSTASAPAVRGTGTVDPGAVVEHRPQVVGGVEAGGLGQLRAQVRHLHDPRRGGRDRGPEPVHAEHREQARVERPGRRTTWSALRRSPPPPRRRRRASAGTSSTRRMPRAVLHRDLALDSGRVRPRSDLGLQHHGLGGGRAAPDRPRSRRRPGLVEGGGEVAERLGEPDEHQVAERVAVEVAGGEAVLERVRPHASSSASATRHRRRSPGGGTPRSRRSRPDEPPSSATLTTAVTRPRVAADRAQRDREPVPATERDDDGPVGIERHSRSTSRWWTLGGYAELLEEPRASSSAMTTLRCRPPVQPIPIDRYDLPSRT